MQPYDGYNLTLARSQLAEGKIGLNLQRQIKQLESARSIEIDFLEIRNFLLVLGEIDRSASIREHTIQAFEEGVTGRALAAAALSAYARATKRSSDARGQFDARSHLPERLRVAHDQLIALRDNVVAHHGVDGNDQHLWITEILTMAVGTDTIINMAYKRSNYRGRDITNLIKIVEILEPIILDLVRKRECRLRDTISCEKDKNVINLLRSCKFNPIEFFGQNEAAASWPFSDSVSHRTPALVGD